MPDSTKQPALLRVLPVARRMSGQRQGSTLLVVITVLFILGAAMVAFLNILNRYIDREAERFGGFRAVQLAHSGLAIGLQPDLAKDDPLLQQTLPDGGSWRVTLTSENSRLNLNAILLGSDPSPLTRLFELWGLTPSEASTLLDRLIDWVDPNDLKRLNGAEERDYLAAGRQGQPRNASFRSIDEVAHVLGMDRLAEVRPDWREFFTVHANTKLDLSEAPPDIIAAFLDLSRSRVDDFIDYRNGSDGLPDTGDEPEITSIEVALAIMGSSLQLPPTTLSQIGLDSTHSRIRVVGQIGSHRHIIEVIAPNSGTVRRNDLIWLEL